MIVKEKQKLNGSWLTDNQVKMKWRNMSLQHRKRIYTGLPPLPPSNEQPPSATPTPRPIETTDEANIASLSRKRNEYLRSVWMEMYQRLLEYKKDHGDSTKVPRNYEKDVAQQRKFNNNKKLLPDRYSLLDSIHFDWGNGPHRSNTSWMKTYQD